MIPLLQVILILFFIVMSCVVVTLYALKNKINVVLTFVWYLLCLIIVFLIFNWKYMELLGNWFQATPSILFFTLILAAIILVIFYILIKINAISIKQKNIIQEISILKSEKNKK